MLSLIIHVIAIAMVVGILLWAIANLPFIPAQMGQILRVFIIVVACLWLIGVLFGGIGGWHGWGSSIRIR